MSVSLSSCIMTHCICIYFSSSHYLFSFSLNIRISLRLYWLLGRVYVRLLIRVSLCLLFECLHRFPAILLLIVRVSFRLLICISIYVSLYVSQYPRILPLILRVYVCTSLYLCFSLTFCLWMCIPVSEYIIIYSCCVCMSHDPCFCLSFSMIFMSVFGYIVTDSTYIGISLIPRFCLSLYTSFSMSGYIIGNFHVCEQAHWARSVSNRALQNVCMSIIIPVYIRTSLDSHFCLTSLAQNVRSNVRICDDSLYVHISLLSFSLNICRSVRLYCHWLSVYISVSWSVFLSLSLSLWIPLWVFGYIVTDCTWIGTCTDPRFSLFLSVSVSGILSVIIRVYVRLLIPISFSLFVSEYV